MRVSPLSSGILLLLLAMSVFSAAQNASPASPQQTPSAAPPAQAPPAAPSQSPTTSQPSAGEAGAGASAPSQAQQEDENPLHLTEEQKTKLRPILIEQNQQMEALRNDTTLTSEQKMAKANELRQTTGPKIRAILTPEQLQKLAELQQQMKQQNQQPNQNTPAQPPK